jgi:hypothetical protein
VLETLLVVGEMVAGGSGAAGKIAVGVTIRLVVFIAAVVTALYMRRGRGWARIALALGLGVVGTASLVAEPIRKLVQGESIGAAISHANALDLLFGASVDVPSNGQRVLPAEEGCGRWVRAKL